MIYATVEFPRDRSQAVDLTDAGWRLRGDGDGDGPLGRILDRLLDARDTGPSRGDPVALMAAAAADLLLGTVTFIRQPDPVPPDAVF